jgi:hypothetical protein
MQLPPIEKLGQKAKNHNTKFFFGSAEPHYTPFYLCWMKGIGITNTCYKHHKGRREQLHHKVSMEQAFTPP